jgi:ABC-type dipeptide/oligopeptide/nickel transport system permease subunit
VHRGVSIWRRERAAPRVAGHGQVGRVPRGPWRDAWARLRGNRSGMAGLAVIAAFYLIAVFAPVIAPFEPDAQHLALTTLDPAWAKDGDPRFLLGTDELGRDELSRLIYGARVSMSVALIPLFCYGTIGGGLGLLAGYRGGTIDALLMRVTDMFYAFPSLLFVIVLAASFRESPLGQALSGLLLLFVALALVGWEGMARLVRGQVLVLREREFVEAARCIGAGDGRIIGRHILPNVLAPALVSLCFSVPGAIVAEAGLSFLGLGIRPPTASWGGMVQANLSEIYATPSLVIFPASCIALVTLAFTFLGDGLRDVLDPRME